MGTHAGFYGVGDFTTWTAATVPIQVVLLRDYYADGHHDDWARRATAQGLARALREGLRTCRVPLDLPPLGPIRFSSA